MKDKFQGVFSKEILDKNFEFRDSEVQPFLSSEGKVSKEVGFAAYRNNWRAGLASALKEFYPSISRLVGDECFDFMAFEFGENNPAKVHDLNNYGDEFPAFIQSKIPEIPYLHDVAILDWKWHRLFYCMDDSPLDHEKFSEVLGVDPDAILFELSRSISFMKSEFPILDIWNFTQNTENDEDVDALDLGGSNDLVIWRRGFERKIEIIEPEMQTFIEALNSGRSYGAAVNQHFSHYDQDQIMQLLAISIQQGWIVGASEKSK